jgi:hypothetical protein
MDLPFLPPLWQDLAAGLASCLHQRLAWRLAVLLLGALFAKGRRTVTSWLRAASVGRAFAAYYYFLAALARRADLLAGLLLRRALALLAPDGRREGSSVATGMARRRIPGRFTRDAMPPFAAGSPGPPRPPFLVDPRPR